MTERSRQYSWQDPRPTYAALGRISGLEYLQREIRGEVPPPPICIAMRLTLLEAEHGRVVYAGIPDEDHYNAVGSVQSGWISGLMDASVGSAVHSTLSAGASYATLELKINFIRPINRGTGELRSIGRAIHTGRRAATAEGKIVDAAEKLYAHATTTCMIRFDAT